MRIKLFILTLLLSLFGIRPVFANSVVLNEMMPHPSPGSDWVEIYNPTNSAVDLSNWILVDTTSTIKTLSGNISANGFVTFDVTNRLNNAGDSIYLKDIGGATIDNYSYSSDPGINRSLGRSPDGGSWALLISSSKGSTNGEASPTPTPNPTPTPTPSPSPSSTPTPSPTPLPTTSSSGSKSKTNTSASKAPAPSLNPATPSPFTDITATSLPAKSVVKTSYKIASVAAATTQPSPSAHIEVKNQKQTNPLVWGGIFLVFVGAGFLGYIYLKKR